jgi:hypothetical protein
MKLHLQNVWWRMVCVALITMAVVAVSIEVRASGSAKADPLSLSNPARHNDAKPPDGISEHAWGKIVRQIKADRYNISKALSSAGSEETIDPLLTAVTTGDRWKSSRMENGWCWIRNDLTRTAMDGPVWRL